MLQEWGRHERKGLKRYCTQYKRFCKKCQEAEGDFWKSLEIKKRSRINPLRILLVRVTGLEHPHFVRGKMHRQSGKGFLACILNRFCVPITYFKSRGSTNVPPLLLVRVTGLEPALTGNRILNPARLPIPPYPRTTVLYHKSPRLSSSFPRKRKKGNRKNELTNSALCGII